MCLRNMCGMTALTKTAACMGCGKPSTPGCKVLGEPVCEKCAANWQALMKAMAALDNDGP